MNKVPAMKLPMNRETWRLLSPQNDMNTGVRLDQPAELIDIQGKPESYLDSTTPFQG